MGPFSEAHFSEDAEEEKKKEENLIQRILRWLRDERGGSIQL